MMIIIYYTGAMEVLFLKDINRLRHVCKILFIDLHLLSFKTKDI